MAAPFRLLLMEILQLQYFTRIAELGSFSAAGRELLVSQPALSRSIAKLEEELGQPVFERGGRRLQLTDAGQLLLDRAGEILTLVDDTKAQIADDGQNGTLRIAAIPTVAPYFLPGVLKATTESLPLAQFEVHECVTAECIRRAHAGEIDVAILALPVDAKYLDVQHLFDEELMLVLPAGHPLAHRQHVGAQDIEPYSFVLLSEAHCLSDEVQSFCQRKKIQPVATSETNQLATVLELVALGHGVSLIPEMTRRTDRSSKRVYRSLTGDVPQRKIAVVTNPYRYQSKLLLKFLELLREYAEEHVAVCAT
jgi:LysR family transcriptional regulator, hydrogen peroxide-inducible genes activator